MKHLWYRHVIGLLMVTTASSVVSVLCRCSYVHDDLKHPNDVAAVSLVGD